MSDILEKILAVKHEEVAAAKRHQPLTERSSQMLMQERKNRGINRQGRQGREGKPVSKNGGGYEPFFPSFNVVYMSDAIKRAANGL